MRWRDLLREGSMHPLNCRRILWGVYYADVTKTTKFRLNSQFPIKHQPALPSIRHPALPRVCRPDPPKKRQKLRTMPRSPTESRIWKNAHPAPNTTTGDPEMAYIPTSETKTRCAETALASLSVGNWQATFTGKEKTIRNRPIGILFKRL